jgi:hypothetical protein
MELSVFESAFCTHERRKPNSRQLSFRYGASMKFAPATHVGPYEIVAPVGAMTSYGLRRVPGERPIDVPPVS